MSNFLRDSIKEFDHVVWPTRAETVRYFWIVVAMIVAFAVFLFAVGSAFSASLFSIRATVVPAKPLPVQNSESSSQLPADFDLSSLIGSGAEMATGATETVSSGSQAK